MARDTVFQQTQIGVEGTKGTAVPATHILPATSFDTGIKAEVSAFRPGGQKYVTQASLNREWVEAAIRGQPSYSDLTYPLAACLCDPVSAVQGATAAYKHTYTLKPAAPDLIKTLTVEQGDPSAWTAGVIAHDWSYGVVSELGLEWKRTAEPSLSGRMIGRRLETKGETMTAATSLDEMPILPNDVSLYLDQSLATIGTNKLTSASRYSWHMANRFTPRWALNAAETSWSREVETAPDLTIALFMEADAVGMSPLANMRVGSDVFLRLQVVSQVLAAVGYPYSLKVDMAAKVTGIGDFSDDDGVYALEWTFTATPELAADSPCTIELVNKIADVA